VYPKRFPIPVLAREFYGSVEKTGRSNEGPLIVQLYLKTKPWQIIRLTKIGLRLLMQGRMSMMPESIKRKEELQKLLGVFEKEPVPIRRKTPHAVSRPKEVL